MSPEQALASLGLALPSPAPAVGNYVATYEHNGLLFVSGHGPYRDGEYVYKGKVDSEVSVNNAYEAARLTIINALSSVRVALGTLDRVSGVVKVFGMVNSDPRFAAQPKVIDGASDLLVEIFGGRHTRSAVGLGALPMGISVEIEMVLAVRS